MKKKMVDWHFRKKNQRQEKEMTTKETFILIPTNENFIFNH